MSEEEFEHIPWANLAAVDDGRRTRMVYLGVAAIAALVVGVIGVRWLGGPDHGPVDPQPAEAAPTTAATPVEPLPPVSTTTSLLTEADLMAATEPAPGDHRLAVMRAEWFVTDYFTVDGDESAVADLRAAFVDGAEPPDLPHGDPTVTATTYVEWARAYQVTEVGADLYSVAVAFRSIYHDGEIYRRSPVRAAEVLVKVGGGRVGIADLPSPVPVPPASNLAVAAPSPRPAPPGVAEVALDYAWIFDPEPDLISATGSDDDWRVVVGLHDGSGIAFPVVITGTAGP